MLSEITTENIRILLQWRVAGNYVIIPESQTLNDRQLESALLMSSEGYTVIHGVKKL